jgi:outer membrane protein
MSLINSLRNTIILGLCLYTGIGFSQGRTLTLKQCLELAIEKNLVIKSSGQAVSAAQADIRLSKSRALPRIVFGGYSGLAQVRNGFQIPNGSFIPPNDIPTAPFVFGEVGVFSRYPFFDSWRILLEVREKEVSSQIAETQHSQTESDIMRSVALAYCGAALAASMSDILSEETSNLKQQLQLMENLQEYTEIGPITYKQIDEIEQSIFDSEDAIRLETFRRDEQLNRLRLLLDISEPVQVDPASLDGLLRGYDLAVNLDTSDIDHSQLKKNYLTVARHELRLKRARRTNDLNVSLDASARYSQSRGWAVGLNFSWPLLDFGEESSLVQMATSQYQASQLEYQFYRKELQSAIETARQRVTVNYERVVATQVKIDREQLKYKNITDQSTGTIEDKLAALSKSVLLSGLQARQVEFRLSYCHALFDYLYIVDRIKTFTLNSNE